MEVNTESKIIPRLSKEKLVLITMGFCLVVVILPAIGFYNLLQKEIQIKTDGETIMVKTFAKTVEEVLAEEAINYRKEDKVLPGLKTEVKDQMIITLERSFPVKISLQGKKIELYSTEAKVEEVIKAAKIQLGPLDKVEPASTSVVKPGTEVKVVKVTEKIETKEVAIVYDVQKKADDTLVKGQTKVIKTGTPGLSEQMIKVVYEDGKEVSRKVVGEKVVKNPEAQIVAYGTKPKVQTVSRGGQQLNFSKSMVMEATAYTYTGRNTASGRPPGRGIVAVDPRVIKFGTRLYIEGYGYGLAADKGSAIIGNIIDVFMESEAEARRWGRRHVKVYILQ